MRIGRQRRPGPNEGYQSAQGRRAELLGGARNTLLLGMGLCVVITLLLSWRLIDVAMSKAPGSAAVAASSAVPGRARATIVDRNGSILATTLNMPTFGFDRKFRANDIDWIVEKTTAILPDISAQTLRERLSASGNGFFWIRRRITPVEEARLRRVGEPGFNFKPELERIYPNGAVAGHIIGFTDIDGKPRAGVEEAMDARLVDPGQLDVPMALTLDVRVQHILESTLAKSIETYQAQGAAGVVLDARSSEVLAIASLPTFDPNNVPAGFADWKNRALYPYELGSVMKLFSVAAAIDSGAFTLDEQIDARESLKVGGRRINDFFAKKRMLTPVEVVLYSSNIGTSRMADRMGVEVMRDYFGRLGLLEPTGIELPRSYSPQLPARWQRLANMTVSYGHGIAVSPLHQAAATAALINGGEYRSPTLLRGGPPARPPRQVVSPATSQIMRDLMRLNVLEGSGRRANVPGLRVGGKTGTANLITAAGYSQRDVLSSFAGAFPMDDPRYVIVVSIERPTNVTGRAGDVGGGRIAAPAVGEIAARIAAIGEVAPNPSSDVRLERYIPHVRDLREAKRIAWLERARDSSMPDPSAVTAATGPLPEAALLPPASPAPVTGQVPQIQPPLPAGPRIQTIGYEVPMSLPVAATQVQR